MARAQRSLPPVSLFTFIIVKLRISEAPLEGVEPESPHVTASRCALGSSGWGFPSFASPRREGTCCGKWRYML